MAEFGFRRRRRCPGLSLRRSLLLLFVGVAASSATFAAAQAMPAKKYPTAAEVQTLLQKEPITIATWPVWRERLKSWFDDHSRGTDAAHDAGRAFLKTQVDKNDQFQGELAKDSLAWYIFGHGLLNESQEKADPIVDLNRAEAALNIAIQLDPKFARPHRSLVWVHLIRSRKNPLAMQKAVAELNNLKAKDPKFPTKALEGQIALEQKRPVDAERLFEQAQLEEPNVPQWAIAQAIAIVSQDRYRGRRPGKVAELSQKFPDNGMLVCYLGLAKAMDDDPQGALQEFERARKLGTDPNEVFDPAIVREIETAGAPSWVEQLGWIMLYFAGSYLVLMGLMALAGMIMAHFTRGTQALRLLNEDHAPLLQNAEIARVGGETMLARAYGLLLFGGLVLFYLSLPFVILGLVGGTGALLYGIFSMGRVPVKLVVVVAVVGVMMVWAVLKSIFSKPGSGSFGILKSREELPQLHEVVRNVAQRIGTDPVDQIYLAPGSELGVHQEGRGPFGIFGVKSRVLTVGVSTLQCLTVGEFRAVLAHEYGHFSHRDTFYNRFIYQVQLSIDQALRGMGEAGGKLNYVNPFFWFLYLYNKSYHLLSAGYSRSREYLADRMACCLYGSNVFVSALKKVCTEGSLFEMTIYDNISKLLENNQSFVNMYEAFKGFRDEQLTPAERTEFYAKALDGKTSLFASHPTFQERVDAVAELPKSADVDPRPAVALFENREEVEKELTEFLTGYVYAVRQYQAQAAAAAAQA